MTSFHAARLAPDGRLHLGHGPIDLIISAKGDDAEAAYALACEAMEGLLERLVDDLPRLRRPTRDWQKNDPPASPVSARMRAATEGYGRRFITPMAAVAGAVADDILAAMTKDAELQKVSVNNGGDVAFWLAEGMTTTAALAEFGLSRLIIPYECPWRGVATSGYGGRSHSLGIADAVFVLADCAATADAAATLIASATMLPAGHAEHGAIIQEEASALSDDSDLGRRMVTTAVKPLSPAAIDLALDAGEAATRDIVAIKPVAGALIQLQNTIRVIGLEAPAEQQNSLRFG